MNSKIQEKILIPFLAVCLFIPATSYAWTESTDYGFLSSAYNSTMEFFFGAPEDSSDIADSSDYDDMSAGSENEEVGDVDGTATTEYTMPDGTQITVNNRAVAFKVAQKKKELMVNTLSAEQYKEAVLEAYDMTPSDLQELSEAITDGQSYSDLTADEVAALNAAYVATTRQAVEDGEDLNQHVDFANVADIFSATKLTPEQAIFAGASGLLALGCGAGAAAAAAALKKRVGGRSSSSYAPRHGAAAYVCATKIPANMSYSDKLAVQTIEQFIAGINGSWAGQALTNLAGTIVSSAKRWNVDPFLIACQINQESGFSPDSGSPAGACGISQFIPSTAESYGVDVWNVSSSIDGQCHLMSDMMNRFADYSLALAGYNAGAGAVEEYGGVPPYGETVNYVSSISSKYGELKAQYELSA